MIRVSVQSNIDDAIRRLGVAEKQAKFAAMVAINRTLPEIKAEIVKAMPSKFDRPTPYTLSSLRSRQATKSRLEGSVWVKDEAGKGTPATKYLLPEVEGGDRNLKRFERALYLAGVLPNGMFVVPGEGAQLDAYGNLLPSQIVQILSYFRAFGEQGYRANMTDKGRARLARGNKRRGIRGVAYFAVRSPTRGIRQPGIYARTSFGFGSAIKPVMIFVDGAPNYERRLDFYGIARQVTEKRLDAIYRQALAEALASAR